MGKLSHHDRSSAMAPIFSFEHPRTGSPSPSRKTGRKSQMASKKVIARLRSSRHRIGPVGREQHDRKSARRYARNTLTVIRITPYGVSLLKVRTSDTQKNRRLRPDARGSILRSYLQDRAGFKVLSPPTSVLTSRSCPSPAARDHTRPQSAPRLRVRFLSFLTLLIEVNQANRKKAQSSM